MTRDELDLTVELEEAPRPGSAPDEEVDTEEENEEDEETSPQIESDLGAALSDALSKHPDLDAGEIRIFVTSGEIILAGTVTSFLSEQYALDLAEEAAGGRAVLSRLRIISPAVDGTSEAPEDEKAELDALAGVSITD